MTRVGARSSFFLFLLLSLLRFCFRWTLFTPSSIPYNCSFSLTDLVVPTNNNFRREKKSDAEIVTIVTIVTIIRIVTIKIRTILVTIVTIQVF